MNGGPIQRVVTHGTFELDGGSWEVDNNIWIVGDDSEVVVFDAAHDAGPIVTAVGGRNVVAVVCTHGHNDHVTVAPELGEALDAPVLMHPADDVLWRMTHPDKDFRTVDDGDTLRVAGIELRALHTPGHSPGSVCWYAPDLKRGLQRRHPVRGRPGRDRTVVLRLPDHPGFHLGPTRHAARRHRRLHRPRRFHHDRRRNRALRRVGRPRPLAHFPSYSCRERARLLADTPENSVQVRTLTAG